MVQSLQSPAPRMVHFSQQALLALEGLIHPRAGHTVLQPNRHSASPHPYLSASTAEATVLGMPKLWSAAVPATPRPESTADTAVEASKAQSDAATMAIAQEVLQAGQLYSAAVAKLQDILTESGTASDSSAAKQVPADVARYGQPRTVDVAGQRHHSTAAGVVAGATASTEAALAAVTPLGAPQAHSAAPNLFATQGHERASLLQAREAPVAAHAADESGPASHMPQVTQPAADGAMRPAEVDDGYISLEQHSMALDRTDASNGMSMSVQKPDAVKGYIQTAAESSDSQGSLPEIDSGESSDSGDSQ